jgi:ABC-2 family transporter protein
VTAVARRPPAATQSTSWIPVAWSLARRSISGILRIPAAVVPLVAMPMFFVIAFSGSFSSLANVEGFPTRHVINWMVPYAILQGASFAGMGAAGGTATDIEGGFFDRLLLAPCRRPILMLGPLGYSALRSIIPTTLVLLLALAVGADLPGGVLGVLCLYVSAVGVALLFGTLGLAFVYKFRSLRSLSLVQIFIFGFMFLSIGQVPLSLQTGWLKQAARHNPMTNIMRLARQGFLGEVSWHTTWPGLVAIAGLTLGFGAIAYRNLRRIVP